MKTVAVAIVAMVAGALAGVAMCWITDKLRGGKHVKRKTAKIGVMDKILALEAVTLTIYTVATLVVFWHTGAEPVTLTACVFGVCGIENGIMGWIKTAKENRAARAEEDQQEPTDMGT